MHYKLVFEGCRKAPHLIDTHEVTMRLLLDGEDGEVYVQYVGGYVTGLELLDVTDEVTVSFWSAVAVGISKQLETDMRRGRGEFGQTEGERIKMLQYPIDVRASDKVARSDAVLPDLEDGAIVHEFDFSEKAPTPA